MLYGSIHVHTSQTSALHLCATLLVKLPFLHDCFNYRVSSIGSSQPPLFGLKFAASWLVASTILDNRSWYRSSLLVHREHKGRTAHLRII
jgi:hypothetical protein